MVEAGRDGSPGDGENTHPQAGENRARPGDGAARCGDVARGGRPRSDLTDTSRPPVEAVEQDVGALGIRSLAQRVPDELAGFLPVAGGQGLGRAVEGLTGGTLALGKRLCRPLAPFPGGGVGRIAEEDASVDE